MVLEIQVEFSTPISIQGNAKDSMFIILEPYSQEKPQRKSLPLLMINT